MIRIFSVAFIGLILLAGCKNDLDLLAPQEEVMVVYSILNSTDSIHYVRVNKGFASAKDAPIEMAKDPKNLYYDTLNVTITNLSLNQSFSLFKQYIGKDGSDQQGNPGEFATEGHHVYAAAFNLVEGHEYELKVVNPETGKTASSKIRLVKEPVNIIPNSANIQLGFPIQMDTNFRIGFDGDPLAFAYDVRLLFIYEESNSITGVSFIDTIPLIIGSGKFNSQRRLQILNRGNVFYDNIANKLEQKGPEVTRKGLSIAMEYWSGDKELMTYMDVYGTSSIGVVQKRSDYTNIENGHGLFASRHLQRETGNTLHVYIRSNLATLPSLSRFNFED